MTDYDATDTAERYRKSKEQGWREAVEAFSLMGLTGSVVGLSVVDVACGEGFFSRKLRAAGAARVLGLDLSARMIELAQAEETARPLGIEYAIEDARAEEPRRAFDLAVAAWLLVYARDRDELGTMLRGVARLLRPGGRFVTFTTNPGLYHFDVPDYRKYGLEIRVGERAYDGAPIDFVFDVDGQPLVINNYYLPIDAYREAFEAAGFEQFAVHQPRLDPAAEAADGAEYWRDMLERPVAVVMEGRRKA